MSEVGIPEPCDRFDVAMRTYRILFGEKLDDMMNSPTHYLFERFSNPFSGGYGDVFVNDLERHYTYCQQVANMPKEVFMTKVLDIYNVQRDEFQKELKHRQMNVLDSMPETFIEGYLAMRKG